MLTSLAFLLAAHSPAQTTTQTPAPNLARYVYPLAPSLPCPPVEIDVTDSPESKVWAEQAAALVREWYGPLTQMMATDGRHPVTGQPTGRKFQPPARITLVFKKTLNVPAYCSGGTITINGEWIAQRPDDLGMVIHELSHAIQQYPRNEIDAGWLTEGISDYIRWWRYEPQLHATRGRTVPDFSRAKRVQEACRLLSTTSRTIKSIAGAVGVPDLAQFNKLIRAETGTSPRKFRFTPEHL